MFLFSVFLLWTCNLEFETFVIIFMFREWLPSIRHMYLWIYLNKILRYFSLEFMSKDYDL